MSERTNDQDTSGLDPKVIVFLRKFIRLKTEEFQKLSHRLHSVLLLTTPRGTLLDMMLKEMNNASEEALSFLELVRQIKEHLQSNCEEDRDKVGAQEDNDHDLHGTKQGETTTGHDVAVTKEREKEKVMTAEATKEGQDSDKASSPVPENNEDDHGVHGTSEDDQDGDDQDGDDQDGDDQDGDLEDRQQVVDKESNDKEPSAKKKRLLCEVDTDNIIVQHTRQQSHQDISQQILDEIKVLSRKILDVSGRMTVVENQLKASHPQAKRRKSLPNQPVGGDHTIVKGDKKWHKDVNEAFERDATGDDYRVHHVPELATRCTQMCRELFDEKNLRIVMWATEKATEKKRYLYFRVAIVIPKIGLIALGHTMKQYVDRGLVTSFHGANNNTLRIDIKRNMAVEEIVSQRLETMRTGTERLLTNFFTDVHTKWTDGRQQ